MNYTFLEVHQLWAKEGFVGLSKPYINATHAAYQAFQPIHDKKFALLRTVDLQISIDNSGKNYPTLKKLKLLLSQMYKYAIRNGICSKDISELVDIKKYNE